MPSLADKPIDGNLGVRPHAGTVADRRERKLCRFNDSTIAIFALLATRTRRGGALPLPAGRALGRPGKVTKLPRS
jgi:hypothetical protein